MVFLLLVCLIFVLVLLVRLFVCAVFLLMCDIVVQRNNTRLLVSWLALQYGDTTNISTETKITTQRQNTTAQ